MAKRYNGLGDYNGFDEQELTSESGGKAKVIEQLKESFGYKNVIMVGDGATDLETCPPAVYLYFWGSYMVLIILSFGFSKDAFIGFGGNIVREKVKQNSLWFVQSFKELIDQLS